jgi:hypothetical protein
MNDNKKGVVNIHGKEYMTVARRVELAHEDKFFTKVYTEVLFNNPDVVVRATVTIDGNDYTGISSVSLNSSKLIEKQNPYEVAETSAVGRALGFAGYGIVDSIASADEVVRATNVRVDEDGLTHEPAEDSVSGNTTNVNLPQSVKCETCGALAEEKKGYTKAGNKPYHGIFCTTKDKSHTQWLNN